MVDDESRAGSGSREVAADGPGSSEELIPAVYAELRRLARSRLARESASLTLQPTALVHEAYLRVSNGGDAQWDRPGHFFAAVAIAMRRILIERARHAGRIKHGGGRRRVELDLEVASAPVDPVELLAIDEALTRLERVDARKARVVMLRYFVGLTVEETAAALDLSPATVKADWAFARAWLHQALGGAADPIDDTP